MQKKKGNCKSEKSRKEKKKPKLKLHGAGFLLGGGGKKMQL